MGWHQRLMQTNQNSSRKGENRKAFDPVVDIEDDMSFASADDGYSDPYDQAYYITQTYTPKQMKDSKKVEHTFETLVKDILQEWLDEEHITEIILTDGERCSTIEEEFGNFARYYAKVKKEGKKRVKYTTFIRVMQKKPIRTLTKNLKTRLAQADAWIFAKFSNAEHVRRLGFIGGVNVKHSYVIWYMSALTDIAHLKRGVIEIRAERTYAQSYNAKTYVVYAIHSEAQEVDELLTSKLVMNVLNDLHVTYVSFKKSTSELVMKQLHWTQLLNRPIKYETLNNVYLHTLVTNKTSGKCQPLRQMLMNVKTDNGRSLFISVEQGRSLSRKHEVFLLYYPSMKQLVNKWVTEHWGTTYVFSDYDPNFHTTSAVAHKAE